MKKRFKIIEQGIGLIFVILIFFMIVSWCPKEISKEKFEFLLGEWSVERTYFPDTDKKIELNGTMDCVYDLDGKFIRCIYNIPRTGKTDIIDVVYYNHNSIYKNYENLWLSATWPIKVLMQGQLKKSFGKIEYNSKASFKIGSGITEYVKSKMKIDLKEDVFIRNTHIKTSKDTIWRFHIKESAAKNN